MSLREDLDRIEADFRGGRWYGTHPDYADIEGSSYDDACHRMKHYITNLYLDDIDFDEVEDYDDEW